MRVAELGIADVGEAIFLLLIPAMAQLREPRERLRVLHLLRDELGDDIAVVHLNGTDGHDLLSVAFGELSNQLGDENVELGDLSAGHKKHFALLSLDCEKL